ncbi:MAG TPA: hypothetical protein VLX92_21985 [Kofleriaceae bacterium]|nr:hypothetical protein [Kofleriaceae bacterium]
MGADLIGWRDCELQRPLGPQGFLGKLKMKSYLRVIESQVPEGQRDGVKVTVVVNDRQRELGYPEIREQAETFQRGIPACAQCPLSGGTPLGCYRYVTYPVDAAFEELAFELFTSQLPTKDSISDQIYRDIVSRQPQDTGWHTRRGPKGPLARRPQPLVHAWGGLFSKKRVDSAQLLASLFIPLESPPLVVGYARFWRELVAFIDGKLAAELRQRGLALAPDGTLEIAVTAQQHSDPQALSAKMQADIAALERYTGGTVGEIRGVANLLAVVAPRSMAEGWRVIVDG